VIDDDPYVMLALALHLCRCPQPEFRDGRRAVLLADRACAMTAYEHGFSLSALAAAHAELGNFTQATHWQDRAIKAMDCEPGYRRKLKQLQAGYKRGEPFCQLDAECKIVPTDYDQLRSDSVSVWKSNRFSGPH
jgi:hypothetical protein